MKILGYFFLLVLAVVVGIVLTIFYFDPYILDKNTEPRYQLRFGTITHMSWKPSDSKATSYQGNEFNYNFCFKLDTYTGDIWEYKTEYFDDPNTYVLSKHGFFPVQYNQFANTYTERYYIDLFKRTENEKIREQKRYSIKDLIQNSDTNQIPLK